MRRMMALLVLLISADFAASAQDTRVSIASGVSGGTYRGVYADDLEKQLSDYTVLHRLSSGSGENLEMLADGRAEFGFAQADVYALRLAAEPERYSSFKVLGRLGVECLFIAVRRDGTIHALAELGAPIGEPKATTIWRLYEMISGQDLSDRDVRKRIDSFRHPIPDVPVTAIYSKSDAIVSWEIAKIPTGKKVENIGVNTSHLGMGFNPAVFFALADRLRQVEGEWAPFEIEGIRKFFYH